MVSRWLLVILVLLGPLTLRARAQEAITVQGEILDMACYMAEEKKGPSHKSCAQLCAKQGVPMGVLTDGGEVYLLIEDHANNAPYEALKTLAGMRAALSGKKFVRQGVASSQVGSSKGL